MTADSPNSRDPTKPVTDDTAIPRRWPARLCIGICSYFLLSALTLPFANRIWLGEAPPLAIIQLPKSFLKSLVHALLMAMLNWFGLSRGSFSPDYVATHGWAMLVTVTLPALLIILLFVRIRPLRQRRFIIAIVVCAAIDAVVTVGIDNASNFKLFNATYL